MSLPKDMVWQYNSDIGKWEVHLRSTVKESQKNNKLAWENQRKKNKPKP